MNLGTVFVDVDSTVADLAPEWLKWYNRDYDDDLKPEDLTGWSLHDKVDKECGYKIYDYLEDPNLYNDILPIKGSLDGVNEIREYGYRIVFATSSPNGSAGRKLRWLLDHEYLSPRGMKGSVHYDYVELHDKSLLSGFCLIDDGLHNVKAFNGRTILYSQPHNLKDVWVPRAENWLEVINIFYEQFNHQG